MIRNKSKILLACKAVFAGALLLLSSCGEEMNQPNLVEPNHRVVFASQMFNGNVVNVGAGIDFADVSRGVASREWQFPAEDSVELIGELTDAQVRGVFKKAGTYQIGLHQAFKDSAYADRNSDKIAFELDTIITVQALAPVKFTSVKANLLRNGVVGDEIVLEDGAEVEIATGSTLRFTYESEGNPTEFSVAGGGVLVPNEVENAFDVTFNGLDKVFSMMAVGTRTAPMSRDTIQYTNFIKCVASQDPVLLENISAQDGKVAICFSRAIDASSVDAADFAVKITTGSGASLTPSIGDASLDEDKSVVLLTLSGDQIYSDDAITVSYTEGDLASEDQTFVESFTDETMEHSAPNILEEQGYDYGLEIANVEWTIDSYYGNNDKFISYGKSTTQVKTGANSLKFEMQASTGDVRGGSLMSMNKNDGTQHTFQVPAGGVYKVSMWMYTEANGGNQAGSFASNFRVGVMDDTEWGRFGPFKYFSPTAPEGTWEELSFIWEAKSGRALQLVPRMVNTSANSIVFYLDDFAVTEWNPRP